MNYKLRITTTWLDANKHPDSKIYRIMYKGLILEHFLLKKEAIKFLGRYKRHGLLKKRHRHLIEWYDKKYG